MKSGCCTICLDPLIKDIQVTHCGHTFHRHCIYRWIDSKTSCPNCKEHVDASQLTHLYFEPLEIIKEVFNDPTVLEDVDPNLLLKISAKKIDDDSDCCGDDDDDILDLKSLKSTKAKTKKENLRMELVQERIQTTALSKQNQELKQRIVVLHENLRNVEDEKSELHRKIQKCLKTAQIYEQKYFEQEDKVSKLSKDLYKKTKEVNNKKSEILKLVRQQSVNEHCENIKIGNVESVNQCEMRLSETQSAEERAAHLKSVYDWILKENRRMQKEASTNKKNHRFDMQQQREINEELRIRITELEKIGSEQIAKKDRLKKHYFTLKAKFKELATKYKGLKEEKQKQPNVAEQIEKLNVNDSVIAINNDDENESVSTEQTTENVMPNEEKQERDDLNEGRLQMDDEEDDDLKESIFQYPGSQSSTNSFRQRQMSKNSLFGAYQQIKQQRNNPFSKNKKRNFSQFNSKGDDGRGGTKTFLSDSTTNFRNNRNKRRRIVKSSASSNVNKNNRKKTTTNNITNFFSRR